MKKSLFSWLSLIFFFSACGRFAPPIAPELTSPKSVDVYTVTAVGPENKSIDLQWTAPAEDVRGKKLKDFYGYNIYRQDITSELPSSEKYSLINTLPDVTVELLKQRREDAINKKLISRKTTLTQEEKTVHFKDDVVVNHTYIYKISPFNSIFVEVEPDKLLQVKVLPQSIESSMLENTDFKQQDESEPLFQDNSDLE